MSNKIATRNVQRMPEHLGESKKSMEIKPVQRSWSFPKQRPICTKDHFEDFRRFRRTVAEKPDGYIGVSKPSSNSGIICKTPIPLPTVGILKTPGQRRKSNNRVEFLANVREREIPGRNS